MKCTITNNILFFLLFSAELFSQPCGICGSKKHDKYWLLKREGLQVDSNKVRFDGVYLNKYKDESGVWTYSYYRFLKDGKVFISCEYCSFPSLQEFKSYEHGRFGEYRIDLFVVKVEKFAPYPRYYYAYFHIDGDTLKYKYNKGRRRFGEGDARFAPYLKYSFQKVKFD